MVTMPANLDCYLLWQPKETSSPECLLEIPLVYEKNMLPPAPPQFIDSLPRPKRAFHVAASVREIENRDGAVLLDIEQGLCFSLTPVASRIWQLLNRNCDAEEITKSICAEFAAPRDLVERDLAEFLGSLRQCGLLFDGEHHQRRGALRRWLSHILRRVTG